MGKLQVVLKGFGRKCLEQKRRIAMDASLVAQTTGERTGPNSLGIKPLSTAGIAVFLKFDVGVDGAINLGFGGGFPLVWGVTRYLRGIFHSSCVRLRNVDWPCNSVRKQ